MIKKISTYILISIAATVLVAALLLPYLTKQYINNNGQELMGREIFIEKIKINYFTAQIQIINTTIYEMDMDETFIQFDRLLLNVKLIPFLKEEIFVQQFSLENCNAYFIKNGDQFNFSDLLATDHSDSTEDTNSSTQYKLNLHNIELINGCFQLNDIELNNKVNLKHVSFDIPHITWNLPDSSNASLSFKLPNAGEFTGNLNYNIEDGSFSGMAQLSKFDLKIIDPYFSQYLNYASIDGQLNTAIQFQGNNDYEKIEAQGYAQVDNFELLDKDEQQVIASKEMRVYLKESQPMLNSVIFDSIIFDHPYIDFALIDSTSNLERMIVETDAISTEDEDLEDSETDTTTMNLIINQFIVNNGAINFTDQRFDEDFVYKLSDISISSENLDMNADWLAMDASMLLNQEGSLEAQFGFNPQTPLDSIKLDYVLSNFKLSDVNIYSKAYTGVPILLGDMYYKNSTTIIQHQINSQNELLIKHAELGKKEGGLYKLPLKLALFILKDKYGDIQLDIPVHGDLSDPKTSLGKIIWTTLTKFTVKIVSSPFTSLGNTFGVDPNDLKSINLQLNDTLVDVKELKKLETLVNIHEKKPEIQILLRYLNDEELESRDIRHQMASEMFTKSTTLQAVQSPESYLNFLAKECNIDSLTVEGYETILIDEKLVKQACINNRIQRVSQVQQYLNILDPNNSIQFIEYDSENIRNIGSSPMYVVEYTLAEDN